MVPAVTTDTAAPVEPVAAPANEPAEPARQVEPQPQLHQAANVHPTTVDTDDDIDAKVAAYAVRVSDMVLDSHTRVQAKLTEDRAQSVAYDKELLKLRTAVTRLVSVRSAAS